MSKLADDMATYIRTGDLRGLCLVRTRDDLMSRYLDNDAAMTKDDIRMLHTLNALLSSEPRSRIDRARD
jgi:hypothetical protein